MNNKLKKTRCSAPGLVYFWFLNDYLDDETVDWQIEEFHKKGIGSVCLHPRDGLMLPYGSKEWFDFIRKTSLKLAKKGIDIWLYDEDPYPSGNAGGRIVLDHPEFIARKITMYQAKPGEVKEDGLWCFPAKGKLLLCGLFCEKTGELISDKSASVGMLRRTWKVLKDWDSKWYYPATPLYVSDRAMAHGLEYAASIGAIPEGQILAAFTVEKIETTIDSTWGDFVDPLNPAATEKFIEYTYEKYKQSLGELLGKQISSIFTDEPKYYGRTPWTTDLLEDFQKTYGYDLTGRIYDLFNNLENPRSIATRLNYREWCGKRFEGAWMIPVSTWCRKHNLRLYGHISPEDDPVIQASTVSNLMPLQKHMYSAGVDLIIPAVGDKNHPLINIGIISATSSAQQHQLTGVMTEALACSGKNFTVEQAAKILNWQTVMGMTTPVIHAAFLSLRDERAFEAPPDLSPWSKFGDGFAEISERLKPIQEKLNDASQIAPVAILWPIKTFQMLNLPWQAEPGGLRGELADLILSCLEAQVGIQLLDEEDFQRCEMQDGKLTIGKAAYSQVIVPGSTIWQKKTWELLKQYNKQNIKIWQYGSKARFLQNNTKVESIDKYPFEELEQDDIKNKLPKLIDISAAESEQIRVSAWKKNNAEFYLLCYLGDGTIKAKINKQNIELSSTEISVIRDCGFAEL